MISLKSGNYPVIIFVIFLKNDNLGLKMNFEIARNSAFLKPLDLRFKIFRTFENEIEEI